jgi:hypothetical protein
MEPLRGRSLALSRCSALAGWAVSPAEVLGVSVRVQAPLPVTLLVALLVAPLSRRLMALPLQLLKNH